MIKLQLTEEEVKRLWNALAAMQRLEVKACARNFATEEKDRQLAIKMCKAAGWQDELNQLQGGV